MLQKKTYLAALHKMSTQTVRSSQVFWKKVFPIVIKKINKMTKRRDKKSTKLLEQVSLEQDHDSFS